MVKIFDQRDVCRYLMLRTNSYIISESPRSTRAMLQRCTYGGYVPETVDETFNCHGQLSRIRCLKHIIQ